MIVKTCAHCNKAYRVDQGQNDLAEFADDHAILPDEVNWLLTVRLFGIETANCLFPFTSPMSRSEKFSIALLVVLLLLGAHLEYVFSH